MFCCSPMSVGAKIMWSNVSWSKCREQMMRHGSDPGDVCVVQGRSVVVTWAGSGQVKVQKKQANVKDGDYVITPYRSLAERDRPPVYPPLTCTALAQCSGQMWNYALANKWHPTHYVWTSPCNVKGKQVLDKRFCVCRSRLTISFL